MKIFDKNDWDHLHDVILDATWNTTKKQCSQKELEKIFESLPAHLKEMAIKWGMNDTVFRDEVWYIFRNI